MNLSIYEIITYFSYLLALIVYFFYGYKLNNYSEPLHEKTKYIYDFILILFTYIPFIVSLLWIFYNNSGVKYQYFILINLFIIMFLITPLIVFKDIVLTGEYSLSVLHKDDFLDLNKYDKRGNLIGKLDKDDILSEKGDSERKKEEYEEEIKRLVKDNENISKKEKEKLEKLENKKTKLEKLKKEYEDNNLTWIIFVILLIPLIIITFSYNYENSNSSDKIIKIISIVINSLIIYYIIKNIVDYFYDTNELEKKIEEIKKNINNKTDEFSKNESENSKNISENQEKISELDKIINNINIKFRAAESEYNNRYDLRSGIYD